MHIYDETKDIRVNNSAVTLGKFDAFHLGHQRLINIINEKKKEYGYETVLFSFDTTGIKHLPSVTTKAERIDICNELGIDNLVFYPVNKETMAIEPENFIKDVLVKSMGAKVIVTGRDFCFGRNRRGSVEMLEKYAVESGYELIVADDVMSNGEKVSSSNIKDYLTSGNIEMSNKMLGYNYFIKGQVVAGKQNGRKIDTRTINISPDENKILPPRGVYKTNTHIDSRVFKSITNVGINPTVKEDGRIVVETHILDFNEDIYDKEVKIEFIKFIREERKFPDLNALKRQIILDISEANL